MFCAIFFSRWLGCQKAAKSMQHAAARLKCRKCPRGATSKEGGVGVGGRGVAGRLQQKSLGKKTGRRL